MLVGVVRDFLYSYKSVDDLKDQNPGAVGGSQGSCGCQYSRKPEVSAERTVSWMSEYYGRSRKRVSGVSRQGKGGTRTARRCTGDLCSFSIVWRGIFGPRPSYMWIVGASLMVLYRGQVHVQNIVKIHESRTLRAMPEPVHAGGPSNMHGEETQGQ